MSIFLLFMNMAELDAATYWVGNSKLCQGNHVFKNLNDALIAANNNRDDQDVIHLTETVNYEGSFEALNLGQNRSTQLSIIGGYSDCYTRPSKRTSLGHAAGTVLRLSASSLNPVTVQLTNLELAGSQQTGLMAEGSIQVELNNVIIRKNLVRGINVLNGGHVNILANSAIESNGSINQTWEGGGVKCMGEHTEVLLRGSMRKNQAYFGGNIASLMGCIVKISDGAEITGSAKTGEYDAEFGGGAYVGYGGTLFAEGGHQGILFAENMAFEGGGVFVQFDGFAQLYNTVLDGNTATYGASLLAKDGLGDGIQIYMDQNLQCMDASGCSVIKNSLSHFAANILGMYDARIIINRTTIKHNVNNSQGVGLIQSMHESLIRLNRVAIIDNQMEAGLSLGANGRSDGQFELSHVTLANNTSEFFPYKPYSLHGYYSGNFHIENSIFTDTIGIDVSSHSVHATGKCNLFDLDHNASGEGFVFAHSTFHIGSPMFSDVTDDYQQDIDSIGVDMCQSDGFDWTDSRDINGVIEPVDVLTNPQGIPGERGGLYDAGAYESIF